MGIEFVGLKIKDGDKEVQDQLLYGGICQRGCYADHLVIKNSHLIPLDFKSTLEEKIAIPEAYLTAY